MTHLLRLCPPRPPMGMPARCSSSKAGNSTCSDASCDDRLATSCPLTAGEFELLCAFARHPNRVLNRDQLIDLVKGREWAAYDRGVDTQVMRLRKKIEPDPSNPRLIKTVRGAGYVFAAAVMVG